MKNILVVGSLNMDLVINTPRVPALGETISGSDFFTAPGGKGQNQAIASARLGCDVKMIGAVGKDLYGEELIKNLEQNNVDATGVQVKDTNSGIAFITVCGGDNSIILDGGANQQLGKEDIDCNVSLFEWADIIALQFEITFEAVKHAIKTAKGYGKNVMLNPAPMKDFESGILSDVDIFTPNRHEASMLFGEKIEDIRDAERAAEYFLKFGIRQVIITLGAEGCVFNEGDEIKRQPAYEDIEVIDTTAAGDSFIGGICAGLCQNYEISRAAEYATAVSAITVGRRGAVPSLPYRDEVEDFIRRRQPV